MGRRKDRRTDVSFNFFRGDLGQVYGSNAQTDAGSHTDQEPCGGEFR